jgi:hypothetical protein
VWDYIWKTGRPDNHRVITSVKWQTVKFLLTVLLLVLPGDVVSVMLAPGGDQVPLRLRSEFLPGHTHAYIDIDLHRFTRLHCPMIKCSWDNFLMPRQVLETAINETGGQLTAEDFHPIRLAPCRPFQPPIPFDQPCLVPLERLSMS